MLWTENIAYIRVSEIISLLIENLEGAGWHNDPNSIIILYIFIEDVKPRQHSIIYLK